MRSVTGIIMCIWCACNVVSVLATEPATDWQSVEIVRFFAEEANQGVAVDDRHFYVITNRRIGKYDKNDGRRVGRWSDSKDGPFTHLNAGYVKDGKLICAHSNFPDVPMFSSVEVWDVETMEHVGSHSFGIGPGSLTWTTEKDGFYYTCYADYASKSGNPGKGPVHTQLVRYDAQWRVVGGWGFPKELIKRFGQSSSSGGAFGPGGFLYVTGHDAAEVYVLDFPKAGSTLRWIATISVPLQGQAFAWDPTDEFVLYGIVRKEKQVVVIRIEPGTGFRRTDMSAP